MLPFGLAAQSFGLRQKFLLAFLGLVLGLVLGLLLLVENRQRASIVHQMEKRGLVVATHLAAVSAKSLLTYNFIALEQDVENLSRDPDLLYAIVLDRDGRVAAYSGHDEKQGLVLPDAVSQRAAGTLRPLVQRVPSAASVPEHYDIAVPVFIQGQTEKWGTVRVGLSLGDMWTEIRRTRHQVLLLGVAGVLIGSVVAAWLARRIAAPIRTLTAGTLEVARGNLHHTIAVRSGDEIAVLATNFNQMTSELLKHRIALEQTNTQLDHKVRELSILANYNANILTSMTSGLFTLDLVGCFETCNTTAETIIGRRLADLRGHSYERVFTDNAPFAQVLEMSRYHGTPLTMPRLDFRRGDGRVVPLALRTAMLHDHDGHTVGLLAVFDDLSPLQTLEQQLRRADRLASLGQMAAGIAHEIKNPLASIRTFAQLVSRKHHDPSFVEKFERIVPRELDRINLIIEELLELARPARLHCAPVDITTVLQRVLEVYGERMQQQNISLKTTFAANVPPLLADAEQLYRGFANIVLNALEAMPTGGELHMACRSVPKMFTDFTASGFRNPRAEFAADTSETLEVCTSAVEVVVSDSGEGIPPEQLDMVFTPFHTTKPKGTGLGLALTHKIIEEHHGSIHMTSQVKRGTVVTVTLPAAIPLSTAHIS
jgi:two-component system sensor histidine kinase AtoS